MHWHTMWAHLVALGLDKDLLATAVALAGASLAAWRPLRRHHAAQQRIADLLDTDTPGGLSDVDAQLRSLRGATPRPARSPQSPPR